MRIAVFTELYSPSIGGQEMFFAGIGEALKKRGHTLEVYCISHQPGLTETESVGGTAVHRFPPAPTYKSPHLQSAKRNWLAIIRYALWTRSVAKASTHDFYLINQWPLLHVLTLPAAARRRALLHWCEVRRSPFYRLVQKLLPRQVRLNAAISESVAEQIGATSGRFVSVLPSGLNLDDRPARKPASNQRSGIVVLGRVATHKNLIMLVDAFDILKARGYAGRLKIAGDGPAMPELAARCAASPYRDEIDLLGFISNDMKFQLLAESEIFAMPSKREGFPHVISESMLEGLPVVTADYPENGTRDIVERFGVGVVTQPNAQAFADGILEVISNWDTHSARGLEAATQLDWNGIAERLERNLLESQETTRA